jgi:NADH:ubiquinone oxidoreductase subunit 2 (subunit N)
VFYYLLAFLNLVLILLNFNLKDIVFFSSLQAITSINSLKVLSLISVLAIAGVPPAPMFFIKISILTTLFAKNSLSMVVIIFFLTIISMVFYLQLIRFLVSKKTKPLLIYEKNTVLFVRPIVVMLVIVVLLNISLISTILDVSTFLDLLLLI